MGRINKYKSFLTINEKVYLSNTIFRKYSLVVDPYSGVGIFNLDLRGGYKNIEMEVQMYGNKEDKQLIFRMPSKLNHLPEKMDIFETIIKDVLYVLNKNKLGYEFTLDEMKSERLPLRQYALVSVNEELSIAELERLSQTTKIVNPKIKDMGDFDKMIYKTNESMFDTLDNNQQDILIQLNTMVKDDSELLHIDRVQDYPNKPIGGDNPYWQCKYCGQSDPYVDIEGHFSSCEWENKFYQFKGLKDQLPKDVQDNLDDYLDELNYHEIFK